VVVSDSGISVDPAVLSLRLDRAPVDDGSEPLVVLAEGKEVRFLGEVFRFPKGLRQRQIICLLYQHYLVGELWVSSEEIAEQIGLGSNTRVRDVFKKSDAWNRLLTERNGLCGFCWPGDGGVKSS
jgi:hypothetical protein